MLFLENLFNNEQEFIKYKHTYTKQDIALALKQNQNELYIPYLTVIHA